MNKQKLTRLLSLFLTLALLTGMLLVTSATAEVVVPPEKGAASFLGQSDMDASLSADPGQIMADANGGKALGVFQLKAASPEKHYLFSAFYFTDGSNFYIVSDSMLDGAINDGYDSFTLVGLKGNMTASYLGKDDFFTYFHADGLKSYTPLKMASTPVNKGINFFLDTDNSGKLNLYGGEIDLSECKTENDYIFVSDITVNSNLYFGMPVVSTDKELVGETYPGKENKLAIFRFVGTNFEFASEYALSAASGRQGGSDEPNNPVGQGGSDEPNNPGGQGGSDEPNNPGGQGGSDEPNNPGGQGGSDEPNNPGEQDDPDKSGIEAIIEEILKDKTKLYLIIGVAAVAAFLLWQKKGKKQPQQQAVQGSIPLDSSRVNVGTGFDKSSPLDFSRMNVGAGSDKTRNQTDSAADRQDIYGPTVPNPSEAPRHTAPVLEKRTVPLAQWQVRCVKGPLSGRVYPLSGKLTFGRGAQCDVKFSQDAPGISSMHCQVSVKGDQVFLQDLGSSYGTYYPQNNLLNSKTDYPLHTGEVFTLAQDGASFRLEKMGAAAETVGFAIKDANGRIYRSDASMRLTLGRNSGCQGGFDGVDSSVSGRHCVLYREDGKLYLMDLDSTNGTFFSQQERLKANVPYRIRKGMAFYLATSKNTFVVVEE